MEPVPRLYDSKSHVWPHLSGHGISPTTLSAPYIDPKSAVRHGKKRPHGAFCSAEFSQLDLVRGEKRKLCPWLPGLTDKATHRLRQFRRSRAVGRPEHIRGTPSPAQRRLRSAALLPVNTRETSPSCRFTSVKGSGPQTDNRDASETRTPHRCARNVTSQPASLLLAASRLPSWSKSAGDESQSSPSAASSCARRSVAHFRSPVRDGRRNKPWLHHRAHGRRCHHWPVYTLRRTST